MDHQHGRDPRPLGQLPQQHGRQGRRNLDPTPGEPLGQQRPCFLQAPCQGAQRQAQFFGRRRVRLALQVAGDQEPARLVGQRVQLGVEDRPNFAPGRFGNGVGVRLSHGAGLSFASPAAAQLGEDVQGRLIGDAVQPAAQRQRPRRLAAQPPGLAGQQDEGGLEGVLGVGPPAQHAAASAQHHRAVPPHQLGEGGLALRRLVGGKQVPVAGAAQATDFVRQGQVAQEESQSITSHGACVLAVRIRRNTKRRRRSTRFIGGNSSCPGGAAGATAEIGNLEFRR